MATRAEQFKAEEEKKGAKNKKKRPKNSRPGGARADASTPARDKREATGSTAKKATYALEEEATTAKPSRKSTRGSANRSKSDSNLEKREAAKRGTPDAKARRSKAQSSRVRGSKP